jgi:hypothetical protein
LTSGILAVSALHSGGGGVLTTWISHTISHGNIRGNDPETIF